MRVKVNANNEAVIVGDILVLVDGQLLGCVQEFDTTEGWVDQRLYDRMEGTEKPTSYKVVRHFGKIEIRDPATPAMAQAPAQ